MCYLSHEDEEDVAEAGSEAQEEHAAGHRGGPTQR